jgi:hypothetical protein
MQNFKKGFELKTRLGKNCTIDKINSEGRPNICGMQVAMKPEPALQLSNITYLEVVKDSLTIKIIVIGILTLWSGGSY